ncbi:MULTISPECIES: PAS domain-containing sensor histidine kinase [unclassified Mucilaginibacter]|uniref:PAS domain-containing sensor histidine kinase n=1 Tax=unclassified Mucilaginibacter TaxID=2617802 RepID=UPI000962B589|nr:MULTISPECIES: PAS domain-containing sensor histidine kinase [unclassified Mucilaginibacter]OJW13335.1 MAG: PAS domain-containing sensor histidine kinase [Mucilaginibacter sp. 44-25]PLW89385.1 MAG: PAS domain-containing sensor histidine kinase [Mucilaginibacter sp.]HEK19108.1 PAS domain S-box protein [Bacteroidota bacterium]
MENTALLKAIIQNAIDGIITIDDKGLVESINPAACTLFGYQPDEVIGKNISFLMPPPDRDRHDEYISRYQHTRVPHIIGIGREVTGLRKDGSMFPFRLAVSEVEYSGRRIYTGFIHDLSRQKDAEEQLKKHALHLEELVEKRTQSLKETVLALQDAKEEVSLSLEKEKELGQLKSRFVSMASHEFRTPLSAIQLSASLIDKYAQPYNSENITKHVGKIKNAVSNLTTILNDFLSLEKLEAGKVEPSFASFDLVKLAEEITEEMQMVAKQNQHIIYQHTGKQSLVNLDQNLLKNCIFNLIANAIKYSGENTFIEFNTEIADDICTVMVKDNGIGIPEKDQKNLFEPFFRAHNTGNIPGTGLGLNIVARYTQLMGGSISFSSIVNQGTSFTIIFKHL